VVVEVELGAAGHVDAAMQVYDTAEWFTGDSTGNGMI